MSRKSKASEPREIHAPQRGYLLTKGWFLGIARTPVLVLEVLGKRTRIQALGSVRLPGRRQLAPGQEAIVPTYAITLETESNDGLA